MERRERTAILREALPLLHPDWRVAVLLRDVVGLPYREISRRLRTPVGTVKSRVSRGRTALARLVRNRATQGADLQEQQVVAIARVASAARPRASREPDGRTRMPG